MHLTVYDIIKGPIITDKAYKTNSLLRQLVVSVHVQANKPLVREALEKLFNVKVDKVRIIVRKPKNRSVNRYPVKGRTIKKAIVTLKEGYVIDALGQAGGGAVSLDRQHEYSAQE